MCIVAAGERFKTGATHMGHDGTFRLSYGGANTCILGGTVFVYMLSGFFYHGNCFYLKILVLFVYFKRALYR